MKIEESTDKIAGILSSRGVRHVVVSSGSRSLRMVRAVVDNDKLCVRMIVDERVAAFSALGISDATHRPVALVCTSGSAMLNYAPAIAEAYYRAVPLIVITADRPRNIIDINDGQTIHQYRALENIVKVSVDIDATKPCTVSDLDIVDKTVAAACTPRRGPVHINLHLEEGNDSLTFPAPCYNHYSTSPECLPDLVLTDSVAPLELVDKKILIFVGQAAYDDETRELLHSLSGRNNVVVIADLVSNCFGGNIITDVETIMGKVREQSSTYAPDLLITLGKTSPLSRAFKEWLRGLKRLSHWRVNDTDAPEDTYFHLEKTIVVDDKIFIQYLLDNLSVDNLSDFADSWRNLYVQAQEIKQSILSETPWSDVSAINMIMSRVPERYIIQSSNGMTIRYLSLIGAKAHPVYCNRGVNGIDGSTSTAVGFSTVTTVPTLLISGDMSALYDISALFSGQLSPQFKMIIMDNGGGEIFRLTKATRDYSDREEMLCRVPQVNWREVAASVGMACYTADSFEALSENIVPFFNDSSCASLMVITTTAGNSIKYRNIIKEIYKQL